MTPYEYAKSCYEKGKFADLYARPVVDSFVIYDGEWNVLTTKTNFKTLEDANKEIEKVRNKARKYLK